MVKAPKKKKKIIYRSARTGRVVTKKYAESHQNTTVKEHRKVKRKRKAKLDPADEPLFEKPGEN